MDDLHWGQQVPTLLISEYAQVPPRKIWNDSISNNSWRSWKKIIPLPTQFLEGEGWKTFLCSKGHWAELEAIAGNTTYKTIPKLVFIEWVYWTSRATSRKSLGPSYRGTLRVPWGLGLPHPNTNSSRPDQCNLLPIFLFFYFSCVRLEFLTFTPLGPILGWQIYWSRWEREP